MQWLSDVVGVLRTELKIPVWGRWEEERVIFVLGFEVWIETSASQWQGIANHSRFQTFVQWIYKDIKYIQF